jgi:hypothetical protein
MWQSRNLYRIDVWLIDYDRTRLATTGVYVSASVPIADVEAFAFAYAQRIYNACNAGILKITIRTHNYWVPHEQAPGAAVVQRCGAFVFDSEQAGHRALVWVPSLDETLLLADGLKIDQAAAAVSDLVTFLINGDGTVHACSPEQKLLSNLSTAYYQFRDQRIISNSRRFRGWG